MEVCRDSSVVSEGRVEGSKVGDVGSGKRVGRSIEAGLESSAIRAEMAWVLMVVVVCLDVDVDVDVMYSRARGTPIEWEIRIVVAFWRCWVCWVRRWVTRADSSSVVDSKGCTGAGGCGPADVGEWGCERPWY